VADPRRPEPGRSAPGCTSPRTVKYHLGKVFAKLAASFRNQLDGVLPRDPAPRLAGLGLATGTVPLADTSAGLPV